MWCLRSVSAQELASAHYPDLEGEGLAEKIAGKVQNRVGHAESALGK
jgi:hypothetical protein